MNYDLEHWKSIKDYENLYEMSDLGSVKSVERKVNDSNQWGACKKTIHEKVLKISKGKNGYLKVTLCKGGKPKTYLIHRLVAETFIPNPLNLPQVNHINEDKTDNRACNLEWVSAKENCNYGTHNKRIGEANAISLLNNPLLSKPVLQLTFDGTLVKEWPSAKEAERYGYNHSHIWACCNGKRKTHKGFIWRYKKEIA